MRSLFFLSCGCKDSKSVSLPVPFSSDTSDKSTATIKTSQNPPSFSAADAASTTSSSSPSFSSLLRQLSELERSVVAWAPPQPPPSSRHRRCRSDSGAGGGRKWVEESVAVVKESEDPLSDFRRSMLQMIVEKEIVDGDDLRELVEKFLNLNSPRHHDLILRAFAEIWSEVFTGYEDTPDLLGRFRSNHLARSRNRDL